MMGIIEMLTEKNVITSHRTLLSMMHSRSTHETVTHTEKEVCIILRQMRESIISEAVDG
jgi:hypothetical protein